MVATKNDNGVVLQIAIFEYLQQPADAVIDVADCAIIRSSSSFDLVFGDILVPEIADLEKARAVWVLLFLWDLDLGQ